MSSYIKPRNPVFASLMSAVLPGFGQLYNGELNKAAWLFLSFTFFTIPAVALLVMYLPSTSTMPVLIVSLGLTVSIWCIAVVEAFMSAYRKRDYHPYAWQGGGVYALIFVLCNFISLPLLTQYVRTHYIESFHIPSSSMQPNLIRGDMLFADKRYNCPSCKDHVKRGDVAIFVYPNDRNRYYIKRIIGLPGDRIKISDKQVFINGKSISGKPIRQHALVMVKETYGEKSWHVIWKKPDTKLKDINVTVPNGEVFVLGDNRNESNDSRFFETVPLQDVVAKARQIWFSFNADLGGVVWERSGKVIQ